MNQKESALREVIGEYEDERSLTASRLDNLKVRRARLELAREAILEQGGHAEADRLRTEITDLDHHMESSIELLRKLDGLIGLYTATLEKIEKAATHS